MATVRPNNTTNEAEEKGWRITLFGTTIMVNQREQADVETAPAAAPEPEFVPMQVALDPKLFDYVAVFIGADYCPHCKEFAPTVKAATPTLEQDKRCKVLFLSNDRTQDAFEASCKKNTGIDIVPYDLQKTRAVRDLFDLDTIPAFMILKNKDFQSPTPPVVSNARHTLVADPDARNFPWVSDAPMTFMDRFVIRGKYGKWYELGHHVNPDFPDQIYMDEHAVRARAGLLNVVTW